MTTSQTNPPSPRRRRGIRPARTTDDLPLPDAPTTATNGWRASVAASVSVKAARPKKNGSSSSRNGPQAAVGADLGADGFDLLQRERPRRLPANGGGQDLERRFVRGARRQIDPGVELEEAQRRIGAGEQHRDDRKARLPPLPVERQIPLPLLPGAEAFGTEEDGDGAAGRERPLQRLRPRLSGGEIPAVEEDADAAIVQAPGDLRHRRMIDRVIAEEDVEPVPQRPSPRQVSVPYPNRGTGRAP